ncbi:hypothetical protein GWP85_07110 [Acinetobacter beijerinckii]|uniref:cell envelope integrity protein TolA n=1 Tax=Acinetobacter beijerinckii TaxID=262668 RepID=UPI0023DDF774|nr:cell envelope integrity protein TolA [Acinetobacter beijerinckii]MDF2417287.1 hypothetical protein [Acinetobacter beijerinckii]
MSYKKLVLFASLIILSNSIFAQMMDVVVPKTVLRTEQEQKEIRAVAQFKYHVYKKVMSAWNVPENTIGQVAVAKIEFDNDGNIESLVVKSADPEMISSIEKVIRSEAPYDLPNEDADLNKYKKLNLSFRSR